MAEYLRNIKPFPMQIKSVVEVFKLDDIDNGFTVKMAVMVGVPSEKGKMCAYFVHQDGSVLLVEPENKRKN